MTEEQEYQAYRQEKLDYLTKVISVVGIGVVRARILDYTTDGYVDMCRPGLLDAVEQLLNDGTKGFKNMTAEDLADELDLQELKDLFDE